MEETRAYDEFRLKGKDFYPFFGALKYILLNKQDGLFNKLSLIEQMKVTGNSWILVLYNIGIAEGTVFLIRGLEQIVK